MKQDLTIIMYHYIRDFELTRNRGIRGLSTGGFRRQLDYLQNHYEIITMEQVVSAYKSKESLPNNAALLTFDDAYIEHYTIVFPELHRRGLQGSFFAPADPVLDSVLLDVNRLHFILAATLGNPELVSAHLDTAIREAKQEWGLDDVDAYRRDWAKPNRWDDAETIYIKRMLQLALPEDFRNVVPNDPDEEHRDRDGKQHVQSDLRVQMEQRVV